MERKFIILFFVSIFSLPLCNSVSAEKIVFLTLEKDIPPNVYNEDGILKGIYVEIIQEVCSKLDMEAEFQRYPWKRCVEYIKRGRGDAIFPPIYTEERNDFLYFPKVPMTSKKVAVFVRSQSNIRIENVSDLKNITIGVNRGYSYGEKFDSYQGLKKVYSNNIDTQVNMLIFNRFDAAIAVKAPFMFVSKKMGLADKIKVAYIISEVPSYVAFSKATGNKGKLMSEKFSQVLRHLKREGVIQKIENKYVTPN